MFESLLIANRGEIACRIARTARRLGLRTIAVYSEADRSAAHVAAADEAVCIGPAPVRESYLAIDAIVEAARRAGADAVHPGYGFLSENADFAEACAAAGLVFVGPPPEAMRSMGSKSAAKAIMAEAGVPLVPGYHGDEQDEARLAGEAERIGFPLLVKASAGGGGRGMRIVRALSEFDAALKAAKREAKAAFGDDTMLLERYIERPRHVEVQVMADGHGHALHLFERDCSIQRRHQKIVEEAPAPGLAPETRDFMGAAAVAAARAIGYVGAGTVEFLLDERGGFHFIEMNTRLQVEHPVTEMITGLDLVEWQLRVAAGERLPWRQEDTRAEGHAIEVRVYAEDPARGFVPQTGRLDLLRFPPESAHVRVDSGVREGDEITMYYDPMIAKVIVWDRDRPHAVRRLAGVLDACRIAGVKTNLPFLSAVARHTAFAAADLDTHFIERHGDSLSPDERAPAEVLPAALLAELDRRRREAAAAAAWSGDPGSPWATASGWRLNAPAYDVLTLYDGDGPVAVRVDHIGEARWRLHLADGAVEAAVLDSADGELRLELDGHQLRIGAVRRGDLWRILLRGREYDVRVHDPDISVVARDVAAGSLSSPMPGRVVRVHVEAGATVKRGDPLIVLEAMKMEHTIAAPADGTVTEVRCAAGDQVDEGVELVAFDAAA